MQRILIASMRQFLHEPVTPLSRESHALAAEPEKVTGARQRRRVRGEMSEMSTSDESSGFVLRMLKTGGSNPRPRKSPVERATDAS